MSNQTLTDKELVDRIFSDKKQHDKMRKHIKMPWSFFAEELQDSGIDITPETLKRKFISFFKKTTGISPYTQCPECKNELLPRNSQYGYFVGCSRFPKCKFMATKTKPYRPK